jgi:hypothetical protein
MLNCERPHRYPPLPADEFERRLDGFMSDYIAVARHVLRHPNDYAATPAIMALCDAIERRTLPDLHTLNRVVGYVLFLMSWNEKHRREPLTDAERDIWAAGWRLSDCLHGPRNH